MLSLIVLLFHVHCQAAIENKLVLGRLFREKPQMALISLGDGNILCQNEMKNQCKYWSQFPREREQLQCVPLYISEFSFL